MKRRVPEGYQRADLVLGFSNFTEYSKMCYISIGVEYGTRISETGGLWDREMARSEYCICQDVVSDM